ncbi:RNA polymerase sigma factor [Pseudohalocynthiibacter aestuariivivens]|jgi:RNA polymerase sigma-70 factor, ECF subfamily|uniref:RNA polymerase sigma factor n=1 Tax=Pseudohalocynthiibacter aestuariivivens TaxID=1591409 RepID=A0ABV5JL91_9RHOB|nr:MULTISPECIES: RNA polymerase sigma factor [Pseudohalocynthiibacter]
MAVAVGAKTAYIGPGSPWENGCSKPACVTALLVHSPMQTFEKSEIRAVFLRSGRMVSSGTFDHRVLLGQYLNMGSLTQLEILLPELCAYARYISSHSSDAEDLVQDAIERTLRADSRPAKLRDLRPWMFRVIRNLHLDELRRRRVRMEYQSREKRFSNDICGSTDVSRDVLIRIAFEKLPPEKREILFLVDISGLTYAEAAEVIGVAHGTVMSRVSRARSALRKVVGGFRDAEKTVVDKATEK